MRVTEEALRVDRSMLVTVRDGDADDERLEELTGALRRELLELGVGDVRRAGQGPPPPGARAVDAVTAHAVLVTVLHSAQAATAVIGLVRAWLDRGPRGRSVELSIGDRTLKLQQASPEQQDRLVEEFLAAVRRAEQAGPQEPSGTP